MSKIPLMTDGTNIQYPIRAAARITGISLDTLRAWERRYRAVTPARGARGRVYTEEHLTRLRLLKDAVDSGNSIGQVASMEDGQLRELLRRSARQGSEVPGTVSSPGFEESYCQPVLDAIAASDPSEASRQLGRMGALLPPRDFVYSVILPLMRSVGHGWTEGSLTIAQEHMASSCLRNVLGNILHVSSSAARTRRLLMAAPSGEFHEFGILAAAILASDRGLGVLNLGVNLPAEEILRSANQELPAVVVLGLSGGAMSDEVKREVAEIGRRLPRQIELWAGGAPAAENIRSDCGDRMLALKSLEDFELQLDRVFGKAS